MRSLKRKSNYPLCKAHRDIPPQAEDIADIRGIPGAKRRGNWLIDLCQNRTLKEIGKMVKLEIVKPEGKARASYYVMK